MTASAVRADQRSKGSGMKIATAIGQDGGGNQDTIARTRTKRAAVALRRLRRNDKRRERFAVFAQPALRLPTRLAVGFGLEASRACKARDNNNRKMRQRAPR